MGGLTGGGVENLPLAVVDSDRTRASRELVARLDRTDELRIAAFGDSVAEARGWMRSGEVAAIAVIPPGYSAALQSPRESAEVQIIVDSSSRVISTVALSAAEDVAAKIGRDLAAHQPATSQGPVDVRFVSRFNAALQDQPSSMTAMLGLIVFQIALLVAAQSFTRERELGTMEQLRVTPVKRLDLLAGKAIPTLLIGLANFLAMIAFVVAVFGIPVSGSLLLLTVLTIPFVLAQIGWGTLISLISGTQQQAMLLVFTLVIVEVAFSGFLVPATDMPGVMRAVSSLSSVQHYLVILRSLTLRGTRIGQLWLHGLALAGIASATLGLAWLRLRAGLDPDSAQQHLKAIWRNLRKRWRERRPTRSRRGRRRRSKPDLSGEPA
jgi:ABC-2 type transport system permease protein